MKGFSLTSLHDYLATSLSNRNEKTPQFVIPICDTTYQPIHKQNEIYYQSVEFQQYIIVTKAFRSFSVGRTSVPVRRTEQSQNLFGK